MSQEQNPSNRNSARLDVVIVVSVALIIVLALVATLLRVGGGSDDTQSLPVPTEQGLGDTNSEVPNIPEPAVPIYQVAAEIDQEVENWHNGAVPYLYRLTSTLGLPPADNMDLVATRCVNIDRIVKEFRGYEQAPREDLAAAIDVWLSSLEASTAYCIEDRYEDPEDIRQYNVFLQFEEGARLWGDVMMSLASYGIALEQ